jgi:hypothetical protein
MHAILEQTLPCGSNKIIHSRERDIISHITEYCEKEKKKKCLLEPINKGTEQAAKYTGKGPSVILQIRKSSDQHPNKLETTPGKNR